MPHLTRPLSATRPGLTPLYLLALSLICLLPLMAARPKPVYRYECKRDKQVYSYSVKRAHKCPVTQHKHYLVYVGTGR